MVVVKAAMPYHYGDLKRQLTPLPNTLHNTMNQLIHKCMLTLAPVRLLDPNRSLPPNFKPNAYCHFHRQNGHDTKHCKHLKTLVQYLIELCHLSIEGVNDQGNTSVAPLNLNLQIFTNSLPKHTTSFVKAS